MKENKFSNLQSWAQKRMFGLFVFNLTVMLLIILRSAGYFSPFFLITINFIVFLSLILAIFLLNIKDKALFIVSFIFWALAGLLQTVNINVWAERAALYSFEALVIGIILFIIENIILPFKSKNHD